MPTITTTKPTRIPTGLYESTDTRNEAAELAKKLSRQYRNIPIAACAAMASNKSTVRLWDEVESERRARFGNSLYISDLSYQMPFAAFINGKQVGFEDGELFERPEVNRHRLIVCIDYVVPEGEQEDVAEIGVRLLIDGLKKHEIEHPHLWLDPEEDEATLPDEWQD